MFAWPVFKLVSCDKELRGRFLLYALQLPSHTNIKRKAFKKYVTVQSLDSFTQAIPVIVSSGHKFVLIIYSLSKPR